MKKAVSWIFLILLVLPLFYSVKTVQAAPPLEEGISTFAELGLAEDMVLNGPYDSGSLRFDIPPTRKLTPGVVLDLEVTAYFVGEGTEAQQTGNNLVGATLEVYFNEKLQASIPLVNGNRVLYTIPISGDALTSTAENGTHRISFFLDAAVDCDLAFHKTTVVIETSSRVTFQYETTPLSLDLRKLPWPIFQERRLLPDPVVLVLPEAPTSEELQSALVMMGSFARMTGGRLPVSMLSLDQLTDQVKAQSHVLMVGKVSSLPVLSEFVMPVPLGGTGFSSQEGSGEDGMIQVFPSPWNEERAVLLVSGTSDPAVVKAAQALSTLNLQTGITTDYSIVAQVNPVTALGVQATDLTQFNSPDVTFADLGYESIDLAGIGANYQSYEFVIPPGQVPSESPYLDLNFSVSAMADPLRSEGVIYLNDVRIGSITLASETSNLITTRINIPASALRSGVNNLELVLNLAPKDGCSVFAFSGLWVTLYSDSVLHLPLTQSSEATFVLEDLRAYPYPFSNDSTFGNTTIVVAQRDLASWLEAGRFVYDLGARIPGPVLALSLAFDGQIKDELRTNNFVFIGRPMDLTVLSETKDAMPAFFDPGSNVAILDSQQVIYRISEEKDLGYLELFSSPWNDQAVILGIFGTSPSGVGYAANALLTPETRDQLSGNFAIIDGTNPTVIDTRTGLGLGRINSNPNLPVQAVATVVPPQVSTNAVAALNRSRQIMAIAMIGVIVVMGVVVVIALRSRKQNL